MLSYSQNDYLLGGNKFAKKLWWCVSVGYFKTFGVVLHLNSDWLRAYSQYTKACEIYMITGYLHQVLGYHVEVKV